MIILQCIIGLFCLLGTVIHFVDFCLDPLELEELLYSGVFGMAGYGVCFG